MKANLAAPAVAQLTSAVRCNDFEFAPSDVHWKAC